MTGTYLRCGRAEPAMGWHEKHYLSVLQSLERVPLDVPLHRELANADPARREAAMNAASDFKPHWNDEETRSWWQRTKRFLDTPSAWEKGFGAFKE